MAVKYYELKVKKLVNFAGVDYALTTDVALKLSKSQFEIFRNGIDMLGGAASKDVATYSGKNLGNFNSWEEAEAGIQELNIGDVVYINEGTEEEPEYAAYVCNDTEEGTAFQLRFLSFDKCVVSFEDYVAHVEDKDIHITADERTDWNKKLDAKDVKPGANIEIEYNEDGTITIIGAADPYVLPTATAEVKGGIKLGDGLVANEDGETIQAVAKVKETFTTNTAVGNIAKGAEIAAGTSLDAILKQLLVTYINPSFKSFTSSNLGSTVECGTTVAGPIAFSWEFNDWTYTKDNIQDNTITLRETNASGALIAENLAKGTTGKGSYTSEIANLIKTAPGSVTYYIEGTNTKGDKFNKTLTKSWAYKYFYGVTTSTELPTAAEMRDNNGTLSPANGTTFTVTANANDALAWFAYPATLRDVTSIIALDSMNAEVKTGFTYGTIDMTLADGETVVSYKYGFIKPDSPFTQQARYKVTI